MRAQTTAQYNDWAPCELLRITNIKETIAHAKSLGGTSDLVDYNVKLYTWLCEVYKNDVST